MIDWDDRKRIANLRKHGFDFIDAEGLFAGPTLTFEDDRFRYKELRYVTLGLIRDTVVSIVHTEEGDHIRIISMRKATKHESEIYFKNIQD